MKTHTKILIAAGLALASVQTSRADLVPFSVNFDGLPSGTTANTFAPAGLDFHFGMFVPELDGFGDPIAGSEHWEPDLTAPSVLAENPASFGYGAAPSPSNALNALDGAVLLTFSSAISFDSFSVALDNATFGSLAPVSVDFFDTSNALLASYPIDQTVPGLVFTSGALNGVSKVVLPGGALYDNVAASAIRHDPILRAFYQRLRAAGKVKRVALTAVMRKLIVLLKRLLTNSGFQLRGAAPAPAPAP